MESMIVSAWKRISVPIGDGGNPLVFQARVIQRTFMESQH